MAVHKRKTMKASSFKDFVYVKSYWKSDLNQSINQSDIPGKGESSEVYCKVQGTIHLYSSTSIELK